MLEAKKIHDINELHAYVMSLLNGGEDQTNELVKMMDPEKAGCVDEGDLKELLSAFKSHKPTKNS